MTDHRNARPLNWLISILVFGAVAFGVRYAINATSQSTASIERQIDDLAETEDGVGLAALKRLFPEDYAAFRQTMVEQVQSGGDSSAVELAAFNYMRKFSTDQTAHITAGSDAALTKLGKQNVAVVEALRHDDVQLCADFGMTGLKPQAKLSENSVRAVGQALVATLEAAKEGVSAPVKRPREMSAEDTDAWIQAMQRLGLTNADLERFGQLQSQSAEFQCAATVSMYKAAVALPPPQAARVGAAFQWMSAETLSQQKP